MNKLDNYIFYTICEKSYELFKTHSNFSTYRSFCNGIKSSIELKDFIDNEREVLFNIGMHLEVIYGLEPSVGADYINRFFSEDKCVIFEEPVRLMMEYFKNSFN